MGMGIFGAVFATGALAPHQPAGAVTFFPEKRNRFHLVRFKPASSMMKNIFVGGIPSLVTELSSGIVIIIFNMIILSLAGNSGMAAYGVIANLSQVVVAIYTGIAQGIQPLLSKYYGGGFQKQIQEIFRYGLITVGTLSELFGLSGLWAAFLVTELLVAVVGVVFYGVHRR